MSAMTDIQKLDQIEAEVRDKVQQAPLPSVQPAIFLNSMLKVMLLCARKYLAGPSGSK